MKFTAEKSVQDFDKFIGKASILKYRLNNNYEIEVQMPVNWKESEMPTILSKSFVEAPKTIHVLSLRLDKRMLN